MRLDRVYDYKKSRIGRNLRREPISLSISNAEEILSKEAYQREILTYKDSKNYHARKMAHVLNSSVNGGIRIKG